MDVPVGNQTAPRHIVFLLPKLLVSQVHLALVEVFDSLLGLEGLGVLKAHLIQSRHPVRVVLLDLYVQDCIAFRVEVVLLNNQVEGALEGVAREAHDWRQVAVVVGVVKLIHVFAVLLVQPKAPKPYLIISVVLQGRVEGSVTDVGLQAAEGALMGEDQVLGRLDALVAV